MSCSTSRENAQRAPVFLIYFQICSKKKLYSSPERSSPPNYVQEDFYLYHFNSF